VDRARDPDGGRPLKADPFAQLKLLDLQSLDTRADQLRHQRATLPEHQELIELAARHRELDNQARDAAIVVEDLAVEQAKVDADVESVKTRRQRDQERMDAGTVTNPKDLERMQHEVESLQKRISDLEDEELEVMERLEAAQQEAAKRTAERDEVAARGRAATESRDRQIAEIDAELATLQPNRDEMAGELPADLLDLYERIRSTRDGIGAAELRARQCGGCRLTLDNAELGVIRAAAVDAVVRCEECQRIMVRTAESGL
jgi:predicted  nucleic acid-binding Zn-ribbon protein